MNTNKAGVPVTSIDTTMSRKLWIHCNYCFVYYADKENIIFLLACQHVICDKCVTAKLGRIPNDAPTFTCPICTKQVRGRQVNNALPTNLKDMFHPEPWKDGLPHSFITSFQKANHISMEHNIARKDREIDKLEKDMQLAQKICRKHYLEQHRLRMERKQLEFHIRKVHRQAQIRKKEAQRRNIQRRSASPNAKLGEHRNIVPNPQIRKRPASLEPQKSAITSFLHHNNHSFVL